MVCAPVRSIIPSLKLGDYLSVQAHKPCSISHVCEEQTEKSVTREHCSASLGKLRDAVTDFSGIPSYPRKKFTHKTPLRRELKLFGRVASPESVP